MNTKTWLSLKEQKQQLPWSCKYQCQRSVEFRFGQWFHTQTCVVIKKNNWTPIFQLHIEQSLTASATMLQLPLSFILCLSPLEGLQRSKKPHFFNSTRGSDLFSRLGNFYAIFVFKKTNPDSAHHCFTSIIPWVRIKTKKQRGREWGRQSWAPLLLEVSPGSA